MAGKRKAYTPFSTSSEAGTTTAPVEGYIDVDQEVKPTVDTGFLDVKGIWQGHQTSDTGFDIYLKEEGIANGAHILTPSVNADGTWPLDMAGYSSIHVAVRPTNGGNYACIAVMGPDSNAFSNLSPVNAAATLLFISPSRTVDQDLAAIFSDGTIAMTADVWNIFTIQGRAKDQNLLQFKITNNSGGSSDIETAFMRLI